MSRKLSKVSKRINPKKRVSTWGFIYNHERQHYAAAKRPLKYLCNSCYFVFQPARKTNYAGGGDISRACKCGSRDLMMIPSYLEVPSKKRKKAWLGFLKTMEKFKFLKVRED